MKHIHILHNPKAGEGNYSEQELLSLFKSKGYDASYASLKKQDWDKFPDDKEMLVIAGGDGAVGKVVMNMLKRRLADSNYTLAVLPLGSANNFAKSLGIAGDAESVIKSLDVGNVQKIGIGRISGNEEYEFFLESFGIGLLPQLMKRMKKNKEMIDSPEKKILASLEQLHELVLSAEPVTCKIKADEKVYTDKYLLAEILNISTVGPNLCIAADASPADGYLNLVLIPESQRLEFASHISKKIKEEEDDYPFITQRAKMISIECERSIAHVDDELVSGKGLKKLEATASEGLINFLLP